MNYKLHPVSVAIDTYWHDNQDDGLRNHLGASIIGQECDRAKWYTFRWAWRVQHSGRLLRLFDRGHEEEFRFVDDLKRVGATVWDYDPESIHELIYHPDSDSYMTLPQTGTEIERACEQDCEIVTGYPTHEQYAKDNFNVVVPEKKQFRVSDVGGHFGGSLDGIGINVPGVETLGLHPTTKILLEFKTHGETSFKKLIADEVEVAKPEHVVQMNIYMAYYNMPFALYMAVNKNTDELYTKFIPFDVTIANKYVANARDIIHAHKPPDRIAKSPMSFKCKFCTHKPTCHLGEPMLRNCRTCSFVQPVDGAKWYCHRHQAVIPGKAEMLEACQHYNQIRD